MLYAFAFERIGVVAGALYFVNPRPEAGHEGAEQGVRVEVRLLERGDLPGSIYSAQPITVGRPIWRADLLESVASPGTLDRAHHHPRFRGWEPGSRHFAPDMSADPVGWVGRRLSDLDGLVAEVEEPPDHIGPDDARRLAAAVPEILDAIRRLLEGVRGGELARPPSEVTGEGVRVGWL